MSGHKQKGGTFKNTGTIIGYLYGVEIYGGAGAVTNSGKIEATASSGNGVELLDGGSVNNAATGYIGVGGRGIKYAVEISHAAGTVTNAGVIAGESSYSPENLNGVLLAGGGAVSNLTGAKIIAENFAVIASSGSVTNAGEIYGAGAIGVLIKSGGMVSNESSGVINGAVFGVDLGMLGVTDRSGGGSLTNHSGAIIKGGGGVFTGDNKATITNAGQLAGTTATTFTVHGTTVVLGDGVFLNAGGSITNVAGGSIIGARDGIYITGGAGAITNAGTITGKTIAIEFAGSGANTLALETGSVLNGSAVGSKATRATNALVLTGNGAADNEFLNFNTLSVRATGTWTLGSASAFSKTTVSAGTLDLKGVVAGVGSATILGAAKLEFNSKVGDTQTIDFSGSHGLVDLNSPTAFAGVLSGFDTVGSNDALELLGSWSITDYKQNSVSEGTLTLTHGTESASLAFDGGYTKSLFDTAVSAGHTTITYK